jgi:hypothetical protein
MIPSKNSRLLNRLLADRAGDEAYFRLASDPPPRLFSNPFAAHSAAGSRCAPRASLERLLGHCFRKYQPPRADGHPTHRGGEPNPGCRTHSRQMHMSWKAQRCRLRWQRKEQSSSWQTFHFSCCFVLSIRGLRACRTCGRQVIAAHTVSGLRGSCHRSESCEWRE